MLPGEMNDLRLAPCLSPHGRLGLEVLPEAAELEPGLASRLIAAFERGSGHGLLELGAAQVAAHLPAALGYWRELGTRYVALVCARAGQDAARRPVPVPDHAELEQLACGAPAMTGAEYVTAALLRTLWAKLDAAFDTELRESGHSIEEYLKARDPAWNLVGRVHFNLADNRKDAEAPFAFLATYTARLSAHARAQHQPLGQALREYAGAANRERLLSLLLPVQRAAESCPWLRAMVESGEIYHPLRWTAEEGLRLLHDVPALEAAGVVVRMPAAWRGNRPPRPVVSARVGDVQPAGLGKGALLDFSVEVTLDGETLSTAEIREMLAGSDGLVLVRGRWVEIDRSRLKRTLQRMREIERLATENGVSFAEAARLLAGAGVAAEDGDGLDPDWASITAGPWLAETLKGLRGPEGLAQVDPGKALRGTLRPYQQVGVRWLHLVTRLGLGACLADDMGLGKTIQVLAVLLVRKREVGARASLLVAPASLLANWALEIERFAPSLSVLIAHPSVMRPSELASLDSARLAGVDLVITSYGSLLRLPWLQERRWHLAVLDEAQAIKNPNARQTRAAKGLQAEARVALTGTPVENRLGDLWSLFDFVNPGLLGSARQFAAFSKRLADRPHDPYGPLRDLVRPYILRRLKTDKSVIADLPEKTEVRAFCPLSRKQAALYQQAVKELAEQLQGVDGIQRKGAVLAALTRLKQICNHPSQWLGDASWAEADSGKWRRLREIAEVIAARQEKALVFTQFREITEPLAAFLGDAFGKPGLVLHGGTAVKARKDLVRRFQEDEAVPFFVLSLKAGGSGLNLTAASHVVHFDRWWNPAVENQATDRAFRIGQTMNVLVHKFVCRGTVEEKIDALIESKKDLARDALEGGGELLLTELGDDELLRLVRLDLSAAMEQG
jgi:hypothetical protein